MANQVNPIPAGYHAITPYLIIDGAADALTFYQQAFSAVEVVRMPTPDGKVAHAEIKIGDSMIMLADECPQMNARGPKTIGATPISLLLYVDDVDTVVNSSVAAGATLERPVQDQFYGDRSGTIIDPFGHRWTIATHKEDVSPEEMNKRMEALAKQQAA